MLKMMFEDWLKFRPLYEKPDEGSGGDDGASDDTSDDDTSDGDADDDAADTDGDDGVALDGGTAESDDNSDEDGDGDESGDDDSDDDADDDADEDEDDDAPEAYDDFELPEGLEVDELMLETMTPILRDLELDQEQAQKLVTAYSEMKLEEAKASVEAIKKLFGGWKETAKKDKEIGGANWDKSVAAANAMIREFGTKEFIDDVMVAQGIGNHPEMIRILSRVAVKVLDDEVITGEQTDTSTEVSDEEAWYGATTPKTKKG